MGFYPRPIAIKLAPVIDYGLKFAAFASLVSPGGGAFANFALPRGPGICQPFEYNYTEYFIRKTRRLADLSRIGKN